MTDKEKELLNKFKWDSDDEATDYPNIDICQNIIECSQLIANYVYENIGTHNFEPRSLDSGDRFVINIPTNLHHIIEDLQNKEWTQESREDLFRLLFAVCAIECQNETYVDKLTNKINTDIFRTLDATIQKGDFLTEEFKQEMKLSNRFFNVANLGKADKHKINWMRLYNDDDDLDLIVTTPGAISENEDEIEISTRTTIKSSLIMEISIEKDDEENSSITR